MNNLGSVGCISPQNTHELFLCHARPDVALFSIHGLSSRICIKPKSDESEANIPAGLFLPLLRLQVRVCSISSYATNQDDGIQADSKSGRFIGCAAGNGCRRCGDFGFGITGLYPTLLCYSSW